jgi:hypothetical protein
MASQNLGVVAITKEGPPKTAKYSPAKNVLDGTEKTILNYPLITLGLELAKFF